MNIYPGSDLLLSFIWLLALIAAAAWGMMVRPLRIAPQASLRFFFANLALSAGMYQLLLRTEQASLQQWLLADMALLVGFMLIGWGIQQLFKQRSTVKRDSLLLLLTALLMLTAQWHLQQQILLGVLFSVTATFLLFSASHNNYRAIKRDFGRLAACLMSAPLFLISAIFFVRALILLCPEPKADNFVAINTAEAIPLLW
jgi:Ca2+/Na+ antiporter